VADHTASNAQLFGLRAIKELNEGLEPENFYRTSHLVWMIEWLNKLGHGAPDSRMLQTLILRSPSYLGLRAISIMIIDENDQARNFAAHGYPAEAIKLQNIYTTIEEKLPSVDAMLTGKAVFLESRKELDNYSSYLRAWISYIPWMNSLMAFPLVNQERLSGSVVWSFDSEHAIDDFGRQLFTSLSLIVQSLMFQEFETNRTTTGLRSAGRVGIVTNDQDSNDLQKKFHMSDRQLSIAKMIADGLTNREIAKTLNFSESTARYETIKIYERLQVKNRAQAAAMVRSLISDLKS
jgi:DNA-binding CsgD family transcriptional regulator